MKLGLIALILICLGAALVVIRVGLKYKIRSTDTTMEDRIADNVVTGPDWVAQPGVFSVTDAGRLGSPYQRVMLGVNGVALSLPTEATPDAGTR